MKLGREARIGQSTCIGAGTVIEDGAEVSCTSSGSRAYVNSQPPSSSMPATYLLCVVCYSCQTAGLDFLGFANRQLVGREGSKL